MEFVHIRKKEVRIFVGSAERELEIRRVIARHLATIQEIQSALDRKIKVRSRKGNEGNAKSAA